MAVFLRKACLGTLFCGFWGPSVTGGAICQKDSLTGMELLAGPSYQQAV